MTSARIRSATGCSAVGIEHGRVAARLDVLGHLAQRELAERGQVLVLEEVHERALDLAARVDLPGAQAQLELLGRQVDEHDLVGLVEHAVGEGLADADAGELEDEVVEALEVLDVDRRDDVDARVEDLVDVLVALGVPRPRRVRVRQLVDERELGRAPDDGVHVQLLEPERPRARPAARHDLEALGLHGGLGPVVRLEVADDDVDALGLRLLPSCSIRKVLPTPAVAPRRMR